MTRVPVILAVSVLLAIPATAQEQPPFRTERPYRGLFGGGVGNFEQLLTLNLSLGGGYTGKGFEAEPNAADPQLRTRGTGFGSLGANLSYGLSRSRVSINASLGTSSRYYPQALQNFATAYSGSVGTSFELTQSTNLGVHHATTYQPFLTLNVAPALFQTPGELQPPTAELGFDRAEFVSHVSGASLSHRLSRRAGLSAHYGHQSSTFGGSDDRFASHGGGGRFSYTLSRSLGVHAGYSITQGLYRADPQATPSTSQAGESITGHAIDAGLNFSHAISFSRRTTFSFGTGSSVLADRHRRFYRLNGSARLGHEIGRTWNISASYTSGLGFIDTFSQPVFSDSFNVGFGGMLSRRLQFNSGASASKGNSALTSDSGFTTYTGVAGVTFGLTQHLGLGVNYAYYRHSFDANAPVPGGWARDVDRQSVRAHLSVWLPLIHRARRGDATR